MEPGSAKSDCDTCTLCICSILYLLRVATRTRSKSLFYRACGEVGQILRVIFNDKPSFREHTRTELWSWAPRSQTATFATFAFAVHGIYSELLETTSKNLNYRTCGEVGQICV